MAEARQRDNWAHTSVTLALTANIHRDPKKAGRYKPDDFNPFAVKKPVVIKAGIGILKQVFVGKEAED